MNEFSDLRLLLNRIYDSSSATSKRRASALAADAVSRLQSLGIQPYPPDLNLDPILVRNKCFDMIETKRFFYLKETRRAPILLPLLSLSFDFRMEPARFHALLMLFQHDQNSTLRSISMRFETPETMNVDLKEGADHGEIGDHDFHHAQLVTKFGKQFDIPGNTNWLPDKQPSFPLSANSAFDLLACTLVTASGLKSLLTDFNLKCVMKTANIMNWIPEKFKDKVAAAGP
jgi:hypothetical protein